MAVVTQSLYTADGNTTKYSIDFEYLKESDVKVSLDGAETTAFTLANATTVNLNSIPNAGVTVRVFRTTDNEELESRFFAGSAIRAADLNKNFEQTLFSVQEVLARFIDRTQAIFQNNVDLGGFKIVNLGDGTDANDAVNKSQLDATQNANDQARCAASNIAGKEQSYESIPWFWSDQYDMKIQMIGLQNSEDDVVVRGDLNSPNKNGLSLFYMKESRIVATDCINRPKEFASAKQLIQSRMKLDASKIRDESIDPFEFKDHAL